MATPALSSMASPSAPQADGMLACLGGFSPRMPLSAMSTPRPSPQWSQTLTGVDYDLEHLAHNPDLTAKIMKKRQQERDRNSNRLTPRMQRIGLDIAALDAQVARKKAVAGVQKAVDDRYMAGMELKHKLIGQVEVEKQRSARQEQCDCVKYSLDNLAQHQRREWDLSDPMQLKREKPARMEGSTPPISSMQMFEGEFGVSPQVRREKRNNQVEWLMAQMAEKKLREEAEKAVEQADHVSAQEANVLRLECERAALQEQQAEVLETARVNQEMTSARSARRETARLKEIDAVETHQAQEMEHNLMRERHDYTIGANGKKRDYKRCSYEEEKEAWSTNLALVQAKAERKKAEVEDAKYYNKLSHYSDVLGVEYESAWHRMNSHRRRQFDDANKALAQEKKDRDAREKEEYKSFASPRI